LIESSHVATPLPFSLKIRCRDLQGINKKKLEGRARLAGDGALLRKAESFLNEAR
jgi:hypothetical protein